MTDATSDQDETQKKAGKSGLILGVVLAIAGAGGGYYATVSGLLPIGETSDQKTDSHDAVHADGSPDPGPLPDIEFVDLPPFLVSLETPDGPRHLRFHAQLEVARKYQSDVERLTPRIVDVLNGYLRAVQVADLTVPHALSQLRGQMLRRIAIVTGESRVRDLLVMEFVLN